MQCDPRTVNYYYNDLYEIFVVGYSYSERHVVSKRHGLLDPTNENNYWWAEIQFLGASFTNDFYEEVAARHKLCVHYWGLDRKVAELSYMYIYIRTVTFILSWNS
jgi:hypothetical protein